MSEPALGYRFRTPAGHAPRFAQTKRQTIDEFVDDFPTVERETAIAALEEAKDLVLAHL